MYASTGDERLKEKGDAVVAGLAECQAKLGNGYLSAFPEDVLRPRRGRQAGLGPYYTLHKIYAGLLGACTFTATTGRPWKSARSLPTGSIARNARLTDEQMQKMLGNEHGGMNEALANLYALTGEEKYLKIARRFNHMAVLGPASQREDRLTGLHANTQIPKFIGARAAVRADRRRVAADGGRCSSGKTVVKERSYVTGGNSDGEHFTPKERALRGPRPQHDGDLQHLQHAQAHPASVLLGPARPSTPTTTSGPCTTTSSPRRTPRPAMMCYFVPLGSPDRRRTTTARWTASGAARARAWRTTPSTATASTSTTAARRST